MLLKELLDLSEKKWSGDIDTKKHSPEGLFKSGSAQKIANWAWTAHDGNLKKAMASLNFYLNRAGSLPADQRDRVQKAKEILQAKKD
jgi:hypothetical protein